MLRWRVQLTGEHFDLEELPKLFDHPLCSVLEAGGTFFLQSTEFESCQSAGPVREKAISLVASMNGAALLAIGNFRPVGVGGVHEETVGGRSITVFATDAIELRSKVGAVIVGSNQSTAPPRQPAATSDWMRLSTTKPAVQRVLRLLSTRAPSWSDLYKTMEILEANGGHGLLPQLGISKRELSRFTQTANSMHAIGDHARHAKESLPAPTKPMSLHEASKLIVRWVRAWLASYTP